MDWSRLGLGTWVSERGSAIPEVKLSPKHLGSVPVGRHIEFAKSSIWDWLESNNKYIFRFCYEVSLSPSIRSSERCGRDLNEARHEMRNVFPRISRSLQYPFADLSIYHFAHYVLPFHFRVVKPFYPVVMKPFYPVEK